MTPLGSEPIDSGLVRIGSRAWKPSPGIKLEPNALRVVTTLDVNVAVPAGPGAGKTELLAQRANFLFATGACPFPQRIVAISFKVDAATNLRERVAERCKPADAARFDSHTFHAFARHIIARHRPHVADRVPPNFRVGPHRTERQLHYDDLLPLALEILEKDPTACQIIRQSYAFAFFDEFQDCTSQQYDLLRTLFAGSDIRSTAVGDPKQRIMGFAGALDAALSGYVDDFNSVTWPIYQNHRSLLRLRRVQNALVRVMDADAALPDSDLKTPSTDGSGAMPVYDGEVHVWTFQEASREAAALAAQIQHDVAAGTAPYEIAVLASRTPGAYCEELVELLTAAGIACRDEQNHQDVLAEPAGALILDLTRLLVLGHAPEEYVRLGSFMTRNCVDESQAARRRRRLDVFLEDTRHQLGNGDLDLRDSVNLKTVLLGFLKVCERQYLSRLATEYADREVLNDVAVRAVESVTTAIAETPTLEAAMARLSLFDAVRIMNVHKSKGLEFEHVYFVAIENETFFDPPEKERPNFFVGISRARSRLVLTVAGTRPVPKTRTNVWNIVRTAQREFLNYAWVERSPQPPKPDAEVQP